MKYTVLAPFKGAEGYCSEGSVIELDNAGRIAHLLRHKLITPFVEPLADAADSVASLSTSTSTTISTVDSAVASLSTTTSTALSTVDTKPKKEK